MKSNSACGTQKSPPRATPVTNKKYAHIQSKVKTYWTAQEKQSKASVRQFFDRKGVSSASTSASSSATASPDYNSANRSMSSLHKLHHQLSGADFAARISELRKAMSPVVETTNSSSKIPVSSSPSV